MAQSKDFIVGHVPDRARPELTQPPISPKRRLALEAWVHRSAKVLAIVTTILGLQDYCSNAMSAYYNLIHEQGVKKRQLIIW